MRNVHGTDETTKKQNLDFYEIYPSITDSIDFFWDSKRSDIKKCDTFT